MSKLKEFLQWNLGNPHNMNFKMIVGYEEREETLNDMQGIVDILDTGLTPDEINALRERDTAKEPEVHTNSDEIRVGSLVIGKGVKVYSCPKCGNMIRKSDNFCPECGQRLKLATAAQRPEWKDRMLHTFLGGHHD